MSDTRDDGWKVFLPSARAAIRAMREPTAKMAFTADHDGRWAEQWRRMIDAASPEITDEL
jgi:hypothetical protein